METCGIKYLSMMRLDWVPLPAPGGPSNTTGPTSREVSCAIELAKASRTVLLETLHKVVQLQQPQTFYSANLAVETFAPTTSSGGRECVRCAA